MQDVSVTRPAPTGMVQPSAMPGTLSNEVSPGPMSAPQRVSNVPRLFRSPATPGAARDATPAERQFRVAIGLRWAFHLRWQAMSPAADAVVDYLIRCMDAEAMPLRAVLQLWDIAFGDLRPRNPAGATTLATATAVRHMLGDAPGHVRIVDEMTQGIWIKAGAMAGALWPKQFEGRVSPSNDILALADQAIVEILCCEKADDLMQCARGFEGFAYDLRAPGEDGRSHSADALGFSHGLEAAARLVRDDYDGAYYTLMGRQLADVGSCDSIFLEIATRR